MSSHEATVVWTRETEDFAPERYSRDHRWTFGTGATLEASAAPEYRGTPTRVNPEEALVAAISSCHMLTFLALAARDKWVVDRYEDHAVGYLEKNAQGRLAVTRAVLRPRVAFGGERRPDAAQIARLHEHAHRGCFVANSVTTAISIEPPAEPG